jgi:hypothetical protein
MDEPLRHDGAGHVGAQLLTALDGHVLEDDQVNRQRAQPRPDGQGGVRHGRRARRGMHPAAGALRLMQVVLHPLRRRGRDLLLLKRPGDAQVLRVRQVQAARAGARRVMVLGPGRTSHRVAAPGLPGCFPRLLFSARSAARRCCRGSFRPGRASDDRGIEEFPFFRDPARCAAASCSSRSATTASSAAIRYACCWISASRGSPGGPPGGTSVTAAIIPEPANTHHASTAHAARTQCHLA